MKLAEMKALYKQYSAGIEIRKNVYMSAGHVTMSDWHVRQLMFSLSSPKNHASINAELQVSEYF